MPHILFICTGNICRSPTAEALLKQRFGREGMTDWTVSSAGTWTTAGRMASRYAIELMAERGIDLSSHRSQTVDRQLLERSDLVLVMTRSHEEALRLEFPDQSDKIYLLSEMNEGGRYDIRDPYGGPLQGYKDCFKELDKLIDAGFERIRSLAQENVQHDET